MILRRNGKDILLNVQKMIIEECICYCLLARNKRILDFGCGGGGFFARDKRFLFLMCWFGEG